MSIVDDVVNYEKWLRGCCDVVDEGIREKRARMAQDAFAFFRATCFRFARKIDKWSPSLGDAPQAPSVGDAHIENWGTWRDGEGRLVWGVNDFDEAATLPYTYDLLRLAASARLAPDLPGRHDERCAAILDGYRTGLLCPGPKFADDETPWLQELVARPEAKPGAFRMKLDKRKPATPPSEVTKALCEQLPKGTHGVTFGAWQRGGGSLGRPRYVAIGCWRGGPVVREAKALVPSAWAWASRDERVTLSFDRLATGRYRSPDPFLLPQAGFIIRRIAPDSAKIDLAKGEARQYGGPLLFAMGVDLASIHLSDGPEPDDLRRDLERRPADWLATESDRVADAIRGDYEKWRAFYSKE